MITSELGVTVPLAFLDLSARHFVGLLNDGRLSSQGTQASSHPELIASI